MNIKYVDFFVVCNEIQLDVNRNQCAHTKHGELVYCLFMFRGKVVSSFLLCMLMMPFWCAIIFLSYNTLRLN